MTSPILVWLVPATQPAHPIEIPPGSVGAPTHPIYFPPGIWPSPGYPAHPIAPGGPPPYPSHPIPPNVWPNPPGGGPGIWPSPGYPSHPIYYPPGPSQGPGFPTHPIAPGGPPPSVSHPIPPNVWPNPPAGGVILPPPPHVEHPIPPNVWPVPPGPPPGGETGSIENPINLPPSEAGGTSPGFWALAYFPQITGWYWVWVPLPAPPPEVTHHK